MLKADKTLSARILAIAAIIEKKHVLEMKMTSSKLSKPHSVHADAVLHALKVRALNAVLISILIDPVSDDSRAHGAAVIIIVHTYIDIHIIRTVSLSSFLFQPNTPMQCLLLLSERLRLGNNGLRRDDQIRMNTESRVYILGRANLFAGNLDACKGIAQILQRRLQRQSAKTNKYGRMK